MPDIYGLHDKAFANVQAYVLLKEGERVGTVAFKFPRDGAGRLYCYLHILGAEMVRGHANGYGYDKRSAAASVAARKLTMSDRLNPELNKPLADLVDQVRAAELDNGTDWTRGLESIGLRVLQAV